jgi:TonB-linked SusC/RagA family outer membrane protein
MNIIAVLIQLNILLLMRKFLTLSIAALLMTLQLWAQRAITGRVTDEQGNPLSGVSIQIKGSNVGATTGDDGRFSINVSTNARTLVFSSVDRNTQEVTIGNQSSFDISLKAADKNLQEVVVVGYGTQRRRETTGSVSTVRGESIAQKPVQSFENALAGKAAGVQITMPNGVVNNPPVFRIRGTNSISLSSYPLIVIDGIPTYTGDAGGTNAPANPLASINPNDIESIDIAKDAAATAIYGSRAANGVVFVTTKRGKTGKPRVNYDGWIGWNSPTRLPELLDAFQFVDFKNKAVANAKANNPAVTGGFVIANDANGQPINTNWYDEVYRTGMSQSHNVNVSGGSEATNYYLSLGYTDQEGILQKNDFKRANILANIDNRINKVFSVGAKLSYSNEKNLIGGSSGSLAGEAFSSAGSARLALAQAPNLSPFNNNGTYNYSGPLTIGPGANIVNGANPFQWLNPRILLDLNRSNNETQHIQSNAYLQVKPLNWLTLKSTYGIDYLLIDNDLFYNPYHGDGASNSFGPGGNATASFRKLKTWVWTNTGQIDYTIASKHNISLLVGNEQQRRTTNNFGIGRRGLSDSAYTVVQAGFTTNNTSDMLLGENYLLSSFSRLNYNFDRKYYISGNIRQDEYSALGIKKGTFWGVSGAWEIARENFWEAAKLDNIFSSFKLRGSYGKVGNVAGIGNFATYSTYGSGLFGGLPTLAYSSAGNPEITWETSKKTDIGVAIGFFKDRLTTDVTYYKNDINNLILSVPQSPSAGLPTSVLQNVGTMYNKGLEITLNGTPIQTKDFTWNSSFNIAFNKNEVTGLANGLKEIQTFIGGGATGNEVVSKTLPGYSMGYLWVVRTGGVDAATGRRVFIDKNGNRVLYEHGVLPAGRFNWENPDGTQYKRNGVPSTVNQAEDAVLYANTQPKRFGGWDNTFRYKGFDVNVLFTYQLDFSIYYGTNAGLRDNRGWNNATEVLNHWQKPGDISDLPKPIYGDNVSNGSAIAIDANVFKGDFVKLRTLQLGYTLPQSIAGRIKVNSARMYIAGQNVAVFTKYPGPDPEVSSDGNSNNTQGIDRNTLANGRTITVGINIGF